VRNDAEGGEANGWELFGLLDHGDFIGVEGYLFVTKTGELSVHVEKLQFLAKPCCQCPTRCTASTIRRFVSDSVTRDLIAGSLNLSATKTISPA